MRKLSTLILALLFTLLMGLSAFSATYYVAPNGSASNPGTENNPWSLAKANSSLRAGDVAYLKGGDYDGQCIIPSLSGNAGNYITYAAVPGETPVITNTLGNDFAIVLQSYITLYQITVDGKAIYPDCNVQKAIKINGDHNIIEECTIKRCKGYGVVRLSGGAEYNKIINNRFDIGGHSWDEEAGHDHGDLLNVGGDHTLVEGNHFTHGGHNLLRLNASYCVIRLNVFDNNWADILEGTDKGARIAELNYHEDGKVRNVFELNVIKGAGPSIDQDGQMQTAIKAVGDGNIIRRNFFTDNSDHCMQTNRRVASSKDLKIYGNVFYNNGGAAAYGETEISNYSYKNNIIYKNRQDPANNSNDNEIFLSKNLSGHIFYGNTFIKCTPGDARLQFGNTGRKSLSELQASYPNNFKYNIEQAPQFVVADPKELKDIAQNTGSPCIDAGVFLTVTSGSGSGKTMKVDDAGYFSDGFGVADGDTIQLEGQTQTAIVTNVNYSTNTLTLNTSLTWQSGKGVALKYNGSKPDIGAFEFSNSGTTDPKVMLNLPGWSITLDSYPVDSTPSSKSVTVSFNNPEGGESWNASVTEGPFTVSSNSGGNNDAFIVSADTGLTAETHNGTIVVTSAQAVNSPVTIPVSVMVTNPGVEARAQAGGPWVNIPLSENQTEEFTFTFEAICDRSPMDCCMGLSNGPATTWSSLATICRFDLSGNIDARNGGSYAADQEIPYSGNTRYTFRMEVNIPQKKYSAFVTPEYGTEDTIATNFNFRTEQSGVSQLNNLGFYVHSDSGAVDIHPTYALSKARQVSLNDPGSIILPKGFEMLPNYPNPFNPSTTIAYTLPEPAAVTITVYNVLGRQIDRLLIRQQQAPGNYKMQWTPGNSAHSINNSGVYILKLTALGQSGAQYNHSQKMLFLK